MEISVTVFNYALDEAIYVTTGKNYIKLFDDNGIQIDTEKVCYFDNASNGETHLSTPVTFAVDSGTTVSKFELWNEAFDEKWYTGNLTEETFSVDGAYTFSDIIIKLGD